MALVPMRELLRHAEENHYAVGYFEAFNMDAMLGVLDGAEKMESPVIIGFGGQFLGSAKRHAAEDVYHYGALARAAAVRSKLPVAVLLNETDSEDMIFQGMHAGFNSVMYQKNNEDRAKTIEITKEICRIAHMLDIDVESEVGLLPCANISDGTVSSGGSTDLCQAMEFVESTGIDALAVSVGNVHLLERGNSSIDFELLSILRCEIKIPLVLHGGTGLSRGDMKKAIKTGVSKINIGTALKRAYINCVRDYIRERDVDSLDPHVIVGWGGDEDMLSAGRAGIAAKVIEFIEVFGSAGKAR